MGNTCGGEGAFRAGAFWCYVSSASGSQGWLARAGQMRRYRPRSEESVVMPLRSGPRRIRPALTSAKPWTEARPADNPHPPRHRRYRQTTRRRSGLPVPQRDDSDRARLPARARRPCGLQRDSQYSAPAPGNCAAWSERENRPSSHVPTCRPAFRRGRNRIHALSRNRLPRP